MNLVVDLGNTYAKIAVFQKDKMVAIFKEEKRKKNEILEKVLELHPSITHSIVSSVLKSDLGEIEKLKSTVQLDMNHKLHLPFQNNYSSPETLGKDRIALAAAAAYHYPGKDCLIIDAGTCITYDIVNSESQYLGGGISPGLQMRFNAVHKFTEKLPLLKIDSNHLNLVGNSTEESLRSGISLGFCAEIDGMITNYRAEFKDLTVILTGGDTQFLLKQLKNSIFANSNFLLEGLNHILEYNKTQ